MKKKIMELFGTELILDLYEISEDKFTEEDAKSYITGLCEVYPYFEASDVRLRMILERRTVLINMFSQKDFDADIVENLTLEWFKGKTIQKFLVPRYTS